LSLDRFKTKIDLHHVKNVGAFVGIFFVAFNFIVLKLSLVAHFELIDYLFLGT
jgi:hypothetical protein